MLRGFAVRYYAVSVDSASTNREFAESLELDYPILSDPTRETARAYGVLGASGFPSRWTHYIGVDGRILAIDTKVNVSTHGADIASRLQALGIARR